MFIIGELINGMYSDIGRAIREKDKPAVQKCALEQIQAGADALDVNCGTASKDPVSDIKWIVGAIQEVTDKTIVLDSSNPKVIEAGLSVIKNKAIINSTTADSDKLDILVPLAKKHNARLIGIAISSKGIPQNKDQRMELAADIIARCVEFDFDVGDLYLDPIVLPVNLAQVQMKDILETIHEFKIISNPPCKTIIGLSNVSQGSRMRGVINRAFLTIAIAFGLDAAILDPKDSQLIDAAITAEVVLNKHIYCDSFLESYRRK